MSVITGIMQGLMLWLRKSGVLVSIRTKMNDLNSGNEGDFRAMAMTDEYRE